MTLRGRFHDSLFSCFSSSPASPPSPPPLPSSPRPSASPPPEEQEEKKQDEDSSREVNIPAPSDPELTRWLRATQAAQLRSHRPTKTDVPSPWAYAKETEQVCTLEPFTCERVTLFLRSTLSGPDMAHKLYEDFFSAMEVTFKVRRRKEACACVCVLHQTFDSHLDREVYLDRILTVSPISMARPDSSSRSVLAANKRACVCLVRLTITHS